MTQPAVRILENTDQPALESFLRPHLESSMFLLSNSRSYGLEDRGERLQGCYVGAFEDGELVGVAGHFRNGFVIPQAPRHLEALWRAAVANSGFPLIGLNGPAAQCFAVRDALAVPEENLHLNFLEKLYRLNLAHLIVPPQLASGALTARRLTEADLDTVTPWFVAYNVEALSAEENDTLRREARVRAQRGVDSRQTWIVRRGEQPVAMSSFNATLAEAVQIGGVYTPPEHRSRGYARAAVAQSLLDARAEGVETAILFTDVEHTAAHKSYTSLGFEIIGDYAIIMFKEPVTPAATA